MASWHDNYRIFGTSSIACASAAGASGSAPAFGVQTRAILLMASGSASSTGGYRVAIGAGTVAASSTLSTLIPYNWPIVFKVTPGQTIAAISNDAGVPNVNITELTD